ncbi:peptidoglycan-binding domain-containing protein [Desulfosarcina ovata]|uniref:peptidoglycan-binding domain-containing protein n=1 Tax=Desulfosarcina ovata TaxID=83564 RepID=UPI00156637AB|nr:peptidoglycan-binding protein [Desulfosarcina ovata]
MNVPWTLKLGIQEYQGKTDNDGHVNVSIPPGYSQAQMRVGPENDTEEFILRLGYLDPVELLRGIQQRLRNLGYHCPITGEFEETTRKALCSFQIQNNLKVSGEADRNTVSALKRLHGA